MDLGLIIQNVLKEIEGTDDLSTMSCPPDGDVVVVKGLKLHVALRLITLTSVASYRITRYHQGLLDLELSPQCSREELMTCIMGIRVQTGWDWVPLERDD